MNIFTGALALLLVGLVQAVAADTATPPPAGVSGATGGSPETPANGIGQKFELPRIGDKTSQLQLITGLCGIQMKNMSPLACKCLADQTIAGLSDPERDYLIASVVAPPVADRMLKDGRVGQKDQVLIFGFLDKTSEACASGTYTPMAVPAAPAPTPAPATPAN